MSRPIDADKIEYYSDKMGNEIAYKVDIDKLPTLTAQNEALTCEGCAEIGKWENENEYGYPSPCTRCKRRACDNYRRPPERQEET